MKEVTENDLPPDRNRETPAGSAVYQRKLSGGKGPRLDQRLAVELETVPEPHGGAEAPVLGAGGHGQRPGRLVGDGAPPGAAVPGGEADENALIHRAESSHGDAVAVKGKGLAAEGQGSYVHSVGDGGVQTGKYIGPRAAVGAADLVDGDVSLGSHADRRAPSLPVQAGAVDEAAGRGARHMCAVSLVVERRRPQGFYFAGDFSGEHHRPQPDGETPGADDFLVAPVGPELAAAFPGRARRWEVTGK